MKNESENRKRIGRTERCVEATGRFFGGAAFPAFVISGMFVYLAFLAVVVFGPSGPGVWGGFVTDFRVWCFGYDPGEGTMRWSWAWIMLTQPLVLLGIVVLFWWRPIVESWRRRTRELAAPAATGVATAVLLSAGMVTLTLGESEDGSASLPFPADRMRTELTFPDYAFHNQLGETVRLSDFEDGVVLLTAIYSTCGTACPMLAVQAKRSVEQLPARLREKVTIAAISLDPENDTVESMAAAAEAYGLAAPEFQFLNGDPAEVEALLDHLQVARVRNEETGAIDHSNLYFLIDRDGRIAYRLNLSQRHDNWLVEGLRVLAEEAEETQSVARNAGEPAAGLKSRRR